MNVLVTGGGGFLGRYVVDLLLRRACHVAILGRADQPDLKGRDVEVIKQDLRNREAICAACMHRDAVFHIAAKAGVWGNRNEFWEINVGGTRNVIEGCKRHGVPRLIYTSTPSVVYNGGSFEGADESTPYGGNWICDYAETKAIAEREVLAAFNPDKLAVCALRPHLIWGPGDPHLLPRVINRARAGRLVQIGDGTNRVDLTYVQNAAQAHLDAFDALGSGRAGGKAYFISNGEPVALWPWINNLLREIRLPDIHRRLSAKNAYRIGALLEHVWRIFRLPGEPIITRFVATELSKSHWFSIDAARNDLGYNPTVTMAEGIVRFLNSFEASSNRL